jgi:hypothetical protein
MEDVLKHFYNTVAKFLFYTIDEFQKIEWGIFFLVEAGVNKLGKTCNLIVV